MAAVAAVAAGWVGGCRRVGGAGRRGAHQLLVVLCACVVVRDVVLHQRLVKKSSPRALDVKKIDQGLSVTGGAENCPGKSNMRRYLFQTYHIVQNS